MRLARAVPWFLLLALLPQPAAAQTHSEGIVTVNAPLHRVTVEPGSAEELAASVRGRIHCLVPQAPDPLVVRFSQDSFTDYDHGQVRFVWHVHPSQWQLDWKDVPGSADYEIVDNLPFRLVGIMPPFTNTTQRVTWEIAQPKNDPGECNVTYSWTTLSQSFEIRAHPKAEGGALGFDLAGNDSTPAVSANEWKPRSETPVEARATMGGALAFTMLGVAGIAVSRHGRFPKG